jgi:hypothetical protein
LAFTYTGSVEAAAFAAVKTTNGEVVYTFAKLMENIPMSLLVEALVVN